MSAGYETLRGTRFDCGTKSSLWVLIALLHAQGPGLGFPRELLGAVSWLKELYVSLAL